MLPYRTHFEGDSKWNAQGKQTLLLSNSYGLNANYIMRPAGYPSQSEAIQSREVRAALSRYRDQPRRAQPIPSPADAIPSHPLADSVPVVT